MKQSLRQRLVGALVVVALGAILWPIIFDEGPSRVISKESIIPPQPAIQHVVIEPINNPVTETTADFGPRDEQGLPVLEEPDQEVMAELPPEQDINHKQASPEVNVVESPSINEQGLPEAWSIQIGAFSNQTNALNLVDRLKQAGFKAYLRESQGIARVLVGPKLSKRAASDEMALIRDQFHMQGRLVRYAP